LRGFEKELVPDHLFTLDATHRLGVVYLKQGKQARGEQMLRRARSGFERKLSPDHAAALRVPISLPVPDTYPTSDINPAAVLPRHKAEDPRKAQKLETNRRENQLIISQHSAFTTMAANATHPTVADRKVMATGTKSTKDTKLEVESVQIPTELLPNDEDYSTTCRKCKLQLVSRNALFRHLRDTRHYADDDDDRRTE